jgi:DNA-binding transcriptional ArsR family regulator
VAVVRRLAGLPAGEVKELVLDVLLRWDGEVFTPLCGAAAETLEADAVADGMRYEGEAGIDRVVLVPSVISRPFITISEWDSTKLICYRAVEPPPGGEAPEPDMVAVYRALGDETRLRILRELASGDRRITDLTQKLGLAKSTVHAHLVVLRSAGLVRVNIGADKAYGLRGAAPDLNRLLRDYLGS